jgi:hypothetical protein
LRGKKKLNSSLTPTKEIYPDNNPREKKDLGESVGSGKNTMSMISKQEALLQKKKTNAEHIAEQWVLWGIKTEALLDKTTVV